MAESSDRKLTHLHLIAAALVVGFIILVLIIFMSRPSAMRMPPESKAQISVQIQTLHAEKIPLTIKSYGLVQPLTRTSLVSRVSGVVEFVADEFREGGSFTKGQLLVALEKDDYLIELSIAEAQVAEAQSRWQNEKALAIEAKADWERSGRTGKAPALALREPQLKAAEAALKSAEAAVKRAQLNLQRTEIHAPFDGRVLSHNIGLAQVVGVNTVLADVFSTEAAEIKLPIKSQDYAYLDLPLAASSQKDKTAPKVIFHSQLGSEQTWQGRLVRASGAIDETSRQLYVVARIERPFTAQAEQARPLKVGEYLTAEIEGKTLDGVLVIPNSAIYQGSYVYTHVDGKVQRKTVTLGWSNETHAVVSQGLEFGDELVLTPLGRVTSGTLVKVSDEAKSPNMEAEGGSQKSLSKEGAQS
ncbi:Multidrug resistance protein MdtA [Thalassocella blandensis]|nr:Multidrug resistance protein MdtA [Thalassocella blandensis]